MNKTFLSKWVAVAGLTLALAAWAPKAAAQDDDGAMMDPDGAMANQAPIAKTMPTTSEPVAFSGWCPVEPSMCPGMKLGSDLAGSAR